jgi:hypothetical protein
MLRKPGVEYPEAMREPANKNANGFPFALD